MTNTSYRVFKDGAENFHLKLSNSEKVADFDSFFALLPRFYNLKKIEVIELCLASALAS
jgi:hypothetical protein